MSCPYPNEYVKVIRLRNDYAIVYLNGPRRNRLSAELLLTLSMQLDVLEIQKVKGIILTSKIPNVFSNGYDVLEIYKPKMERFAVYWSLLQNVFLKLYKNFNYRSVAVINGTATGVGCLLATCCEYRVMVDNNSKIGLNSANSVLPMPHWFLAAFHEAINSRSKNLVSNKSDLFTIDQAFDLGLVNEKARSVNQAFTKSIRYMSTMDVIGSLAGRMDRFCYDYAQSDIIKCSLAYDIDYYYKMFHFTYSQEALIKYYECHAEDYEDCKAFNKIIKKLKPETKIIEDK